MLTNILKDLFDSKIIKYALMPFFISMLVWGVVFFIFSDDILNVVSSYLSALPFGSSVNEWISNIGGVLLLVFLYYQLVIISTSLFSAFFVEKIVLHINSKYYNKSVRESSLKEGIIVSLKAIVAYILLFIFTFYLLFVPVVNIFYQLFLWSVATKKPLVFDSASLFCDYKSFEKKHNIKIWLIVFFTSLIYFIPVISMFGYSFSLIVMTHFVLKNCKEG